MNYSYVEQIKAIQQIREIISREMQAYTKAVLNQAIELSPLLRVSNHALNDAASTIAAINITPTLQEHVELITLIKKIFSGNGNLTFDGEIIDKINKIVNPEDTWDYHNKQINPTE